MKIVFSDFTRMTHLILVSLYNCVILLIYLFQSVPASLNIRLNITFHNFLFKNCKTNCSGSSGIKNSTIVVIAIMEIAAILSKGKKEK